ncbi:hypothetical protein EDB86DRAFT_834234 [Lactarius hatsudake]|nr:hypothetical protein EDB86DRAFT_834234 [Lactarius hatsudake]
MPPLTGPLGKQRKSYSHWSASLSVTNALGHAFPPVKMHMHTKSVDIIQLSVSSPGHSKHFLPHLHWYYPLSRLSMPFDPELRTILRQLTTIPLPVENDWYLPWALILNDLFPTAEGYYVGAQHHLPGEGNRRFPDFAVVRKIPQFGSPYRLRTVLIVEIKQNSEWRAGIPALMNQINDAADMAFQVNSVRRVYWIAVIGPHWRFGVKTDRGLDPRP